MPGWAAGATRSGDVMIRHPERPKQERAALLLCPVALDKDGSARFLRHVEAKIGDGLVARDLDTLYRGRGHSRAHPTEVCSDLVAAGRRHKQQGVVQPAFRNGFAVRLRRMPNGVLIHGEILRYPHGSRWCEPKDSLASRHPLCVDEELYAAALAGYGGLDTVDYEPRSALDALDRRLESLLKLD